MSDFSIKTCNDYFFNAYYFSYRTLILLGLQLVQKIYLFLNFTNLFFALYVSK